MENGLETKDMGKARLRGPVERSTKDIINSTEDILITES
jgi:hypothetical protein